MCPAAAEDIIVVTNAPTCNGVGAGDLDEEDLDLLRRLPVSLAGRVAKVRGPQLVGEVLDAVRDELSAWMRRAPLTPQMEGFGPSIAEWQRAPMYRVWHGLNRMGRERNVVGRVRQATHDARHKHHVWRFFSETPRDVPPELPRIVPPDQKRPWFAKADLGLGCATFLEAMPDAVSTWIAQGIVQGTPRGKVLHIGAGPSGLAAAIDVLAPKGSKVKVHEVDAVGPVAQFLDHEEAPLRCLASRSQVVPEKGQFRFVVLHAQSPAGPGAARHRDHYGSGFIDNARMAYRNWLPATLADMILAIRRVTVGGFLVLYLPLGIRMPSSYIVVPEALDWFDYVLAQIPLKILRGQTVVEVGPARQPFVGRERCPWRIIVARKLEKRQES